MISLSKTLAKLFGALFDLLVGLYRNTDYLALNACPSSERLFSIYRDYIENKITSSF
jgi:hypothetical protein